MNHPALNQYIALKINNIIFAKQDAKSNITALINELTETTGYNFEYIHALVITQVIIFDNQLQSYHANKAMIQN